ncbi:MAG: hypothetical protein NTV58_19995 [Deltaproteobacteria bacterium]|nr:hypothetical protein [Deltaproteobacteria bacterium]
MPTISPSAALSSGSPVSDHRWIDGNRRRATCLSDDQCFTPAMEGKGIFCIVEAKG